MAAFITRTQDSALTRTSRRSALGQVATPVALPFPRIAIGNSPRLVESDGVDLWVANAGSGDVSRIRASDGSAQGTWTGATNAFGVLVARGLIWICGGTHLYVIDPGNSPGNVTTVAGPSFVNAKGITTDGAYIWVADEGGGVVIGTDPDTGQAHFTTGGFNQPEGMLFDGTNLWVTDQGANKLSKLGSPTPSVIQNVPVGAHPQFPVFDGANIWVPNSNDNSVTVVRAKDGMVLATLTGNGLSSPTQAAFDGQRILVTNDLGSSLSMWKATDLTPIANIPTGGNGLSFGACSDGIHFWVTLVFRGELGRL
jgi:YVTN family beta-propeller protein